MREIEPDDHWAAQRADNDRRRDEYAASDAIEAENALLEGQLMTTAPSETELVIVALLMRLYDINMGLLSAQNKPLADEIYETHEKGGHFNPQIFIPAPVEQKDE